MENAKKLVVLSMKSAKYFKVLSMENAKFYWQKLLKALKYNKGGILWEGKFIKSF